MATDRCPKCNRCPKCKARIYSYDEHECPPLWLVQCPEHDDETWDEVYAVAAVFAAESWVEEHDRECLEYDMLDGEMIVVLVKRKFRDNLTIYNNSGAHVTSQDEMPIKTFMCSGEAVPTYTAEYIDENGKNDGEDTDETKSE